MLFIGSASITWIGFLIYHGVPRRVHDGKIKIQTAVDLLGAVGRVCCASFLGVYRLKPTGGLGLKSQQEAWALEEALSDTESHLPALVSPSDLGIR